MVMKKIIVVLVLFSFLGLQLTGCATMTETGRGAAVGAVAGGVLGAILGDTKGAIIGAFAGAIIGAVIGNYYDKQIASRAEAAKKYEYKGKEEKIEIEDSSIMPQNVAAGSTVEANVQYVVLVPDETQKIKITETRILDNGNKRIELGTPREVVRPQGIHHSTMKFAVPKDIEKGDYTLITIISDGKQTRTTKDALRVM
jgi:outer membrane lipoprotein SlyB